jgi:hypothetical protein
MQINSQARQGTRLCLSELVTQRELHDPWIGYPSRPGRRDDAEGLIGERAVWLTEVGMIEEVEELGSKLKFSKTL